MFLLVTIYIAKSNAPYRHKEVVFSERGNILSGCGNQLNEPIARMPHTALMIKSPSTTTRNRVWSNESGLFLFGEQSIFLLGPEFGRRQTRKFFKDRIESCFGIESCFKAYRKNCKILILCVQQKALGFFYPVTVDQVIEILVHPVIDGLRHLVRG